MGLTLCLGLVLVCAVAATQARPPHRSLADEVAGFVSGLIINAPLFVSGLGDPEPDYPAGLRRLAIGLEKVGEGFNNPTDVRFVPGQPGAYVVAELRGRVRWASLEAGGVVRELFQVDVVIFEERGLLGLAIHPDYPEPPCFYVSYVVSEDEQALSRVAEWCSQSRDPASTWSERRILFELPQPYGNHNGGHLIFDAAGNLYLGWGDGGGGDGGRDPHGHGQDPTTFLGTILRIRPTPPGSSPPYTIPPDNPFAGHPEIPGEVYAYGLRNPWRLSFDRLGRLVAADVGLSNYEEISLVEPGDNHGWNRMEGFHCRGSTTCPDDDLVLPIAEVEHPLSVSITGGYEVLSRDYPALYGHYVFGDFVTGQLFALRLPRQRRQRAEVVSLGRRALFVATFGRDEEGRVYAADFARGDIHRITAPQ